jgi:integrase
MSLDELSKFLGHASIQITSDVYLHLGVEAQAKSINKLQDALTS